MKIGDKIYIKTQNNAARFNGSKIIDTEITKVGRKYFWTDYMDIKFEIDTMREVTEYCVDYVAYNSKKEIEEEIEKIELTANIRKLIGHHGTCAYSIVQLKKVYDILNFK